MIIDVLGLKAGQSQGIADPGVKDNNYQADSNRIKRLATEYLKAKGREIPVRASLLGDTKQTNLEREQLALI